MLDQQDGSREGGGSLTECRSASEGRYCHRAGIPNSSHIAWLARALTWCEGRGGERCGESGATGTPASGRAGAAPLMVTLQGDRGSSVNRGISDLDPIIVRRHV